MTTRVEARVCRGWATSAKTGRCIVILPAEKQWRFCWFCLQTMVLP